MHVEAGTGRKCALDAVFAEGALQLAPHELWQAHALLQRLLRLSPHLKVRERRPLVKVAQVAPPLDVRWRLPHAARYA